MTQQAKWWDPAQLAFLSGSGLLLEEGEGKTHGMLAVTFPFQTDVINTMCGYKTIDKEVMSLGPLPQKHCCSCPIGDFEVRALGAGEATSRALLNVSSGLVCVRPPARTMECCAPALAQPSWPLHLRSPACRQPTLFPLPRT